jgi:peroxiredoxin
MKHDLGLNFPLLSDPKAEVIRRYGLFHAKGHGDDDIARPADILLDGQGTVRWAMFTDNFRVRAHPDVLLAAAKVLQ